MPRFVVHEHHASRLHFDFRLEMEGVLKSWAIPRGPSMNPADKRLAVQVDDHALGYADFEGTIDEGSYGAGEVYIWDRGEFEPVGGSLRDGRFEFRLSGENLKGGFVLLRLKKGRENDWLLVKRTDPEADRFFSLKTIG